MRKIAVVLAALVVALPMFASDPADEVRAAETAFAKAFADRDQEKFFTYVADDAHFMGAKRTMNNKKEVIEVWSNYLKDAKAPFSWKPERVVVNAKGDLGLSTGPVFDADGKHISNFISYWQKQSDGTWKVLFDGPGSPVCEPK